MSSATASKNGLPQADIYVGSTGEGTNLKDSDIDTMTIFTDSVCVDKASFSRNLNILETDYTDTPPGYTRIKSVHLCADTETGRSLSESEMYQSMSGYPYISARVFRNIYFRILIAIPNARYEHLVFGDSFTTNGPACTLELISGSKKTSSLDIVPGFYYFGKYTFKNEKRAFSFNNWPPESIVKEISEMEGYVVPVGMKDSENGNIEWRVCYTTAEKKLVGSFNDIQMKLYILLKIMAKHIKQICKQFTSYFVKNIAFWVSAECAQNQFSPDLLIFLVKKSLGFIKHCLQNNYLPNYMIPERNMFTGAFSKEDKCNLERFVSECLEKDTLNCILSTNIKLKKCISYVYTIPYFVYLYGRWRDEVENIFVVDKHQLIEHYDKHMLESNTVLSDLEEKYSRDDRYLSSRTKLFGLLVPDWDHLLTSGKFDEMSEKCNQRIQFLYML